MNGTKEHGRTHTKSDIEMSETDELLHCNQGGPFPWGTVDCLYVKNTVLQ